MSKFITTDETKDKRLDAIVKAMDLPDAESRKLALAALGK
jgi:hypothetical protein